MPGAEPAPEAFGGAAPPPPRSPAWAFGPPRAASAPSAGIVAAALDIKIRRGVLALLYFLLAAATFLAIGHLQPILRTFLDILSPFLLAAIIAYIFNPIVRTLQTRFGLRRMMGVLATYLLILALAAGLLAVALPLLYGQLKDAALGVVRSTPAVVVKIQRRFPAARLDASDVANLRLAVERQFGLPDGYLAGDRQTSGVRSAVVSGATSGTLLEDAATEVGDDDGATSAAVNAVPRPADPAAASAGSETAARQPTEIRKPSASVVGRVAQQVAGGGLFVARFIGGALATMVGAIAFVAFVVVITFYFLVDYGRIPRVAHILIPAGHEERAFAVWRRIDTALGGFLRGQLITCVLISVLYSGALFVLGMRDYAILVGVLAGFGNLVPYLGPVLGGVPAALWVIFGDQYDTFGAKMTGVGAVVGLGMAIQALDGLVFQPRIVGPSAELHPLLVMFALLVGVQFGLGGLVLAVPLAVVGRVLLKEFWWDPLLAAKAMPEEVVEESD